MMHGRLLEEQIDSLLEDEGPCGIVYLYSRMAVDVKPMTIMDFRDRLVESDRFSIDDSDRAHLNG